MATLMYRSASAVAENGATSLICRNAPGILRCLQLAKGGSLLGKCRQNGKTADSQKFFKLRAGVDLTVHLLAGKCRHDPKTQSAEGRQRQRQTRSLANLAPRGGDANVTTRASVEGNDCCCTD